MGPRRTRREKGESSRAFAVPVGQPRGHKSRSRRGGEKRCVLSVSDIYLRRKTRAAPWLAVNERNRGFLGKKMIWGRGIQSQSEGNCWFLPWRGKGAEICRGSGSKKRFWGVFIRGENRGWMEIGNWKYRGGVAVEFIKKKWGPPEKPQNRSERGENRVDNWKSSPVRCLRAPGVTWGCGRSWICPCPGKGEEIFLERRCLAG